MMYFLKQLVGALANPLSIALLIAGVAAICCARGRSRVASWLLFSAAGIGYLGAIVPVGDALLGPLERWHSPLREERLLPGVRHVVVLGSGYAPRDELPVTSALDETGLVRIVEGVRLIKRLGSVRLVVSGGAPPGRASPAVGYAELARALGVSDASLIVLDESLDTGAEARAVVEAIGKEPFLLVTSAYHMPRAMKLMQRAGARPIPAPTGHRVIRSPDRDWRGLLPTSLGLRKTERALHEYLGLVALAVGVD